MILKKLFAAASLLTALAVGGCSAPQPEVQFSGQAVSLPVTFLGSAYVPATLGGANLLNSPVECSYSFAGRTGRFVTPETIVFEHTDELRTLRLDCSFRTEVSSQASQGRMVPHAGRITGSVETSFSRLANRRTIGRIGGDRSRIRYPRNSQLIRLRRNLIQTQGVQMLPLQVVVAPTLAPVGS